MTEPSATPAYSSGARSSPVREKTPADSSPHQTEAELGCSVIVPVTERPDALGKLFETHAPALEEAVGSFEFIFVVPSRYRELEQQASELSQDPRVRVLEVGDVHREASLLKVGARAAKSSTLLTLPAYLRVQPSALPALVEELDEDVDLVMANRSPRRDSWISRLQNRVFHWILHWLTGCESHDTGCGVRAIRRDILLQLPIHGDYHRFLPVLAREEGYRVREIPVPQHPEDAKPSLYGPWTYVRRVMDLLGIFFLVKFAYMPLHFFGLIGGALTVGGGVFLLVLLAQRLAGQPLANRPALVLAVLIFTVGLQLIAIGLVGEIIVHYSSGRSKLYRIDADPQDDE